MSMELLLAIASGAAVAAGAVCLAAALAGKRIDPTAAPAPPTRWATARERLLHDRPTRQRAAVAACSAVVVFALTGWIVAGLAAAAAAIALPRLVLVRDAQARIERLEALEQWTRRLADTLAASRGLEQALQHSARTCSALIAEPVVSLVRGLSVARMPTEEAIRRFADELADPVGDQIAGALILAAEVRGPGLSAMLTQMAGNVARDVAARREAEAERAKHRTAMRWITLILVGSTAWLTLLQRSYFAIYAHPSGQLVLAVVAGVFGAGLWWMARLGAADPGQRFLAADPPQGDR
jgi:Flp pilus assembly protein TadB